ncbi:MULTISPECIES: hypothetical protein [unclassified Rickettsia]|uniref:hypothetical protein n=1 Tax=unclassified Rickettsia TaxID=114295 RepID=UPI00313315DB
MARIFDVILAKGGALLHDYRNRHCEEGRSPDVAIQEKISTKCYVNYYFLDCRAPFGRSQ